MSATVAPKLRPVPFTAVRLEGGFWGPRLETNRATTLPIEYGHCQSTGRIDAFRLDWQPGQPNPPHIFWDSDVAKWLEAACYSLSTRPDADLRAKVDAVVDLIVGAQQPDGYLNVHFTVVEPEQRWTNTRDWHELYCAGHLMEAAVAHHAATGETRLIDALGRYADHIATVFGRGAGQKPGYPGHEEIELALIKLHRATGEARFLELSRYFVDERGRQPHWYDQESRARGEDPGGWQFGKYDYNQSHLPVREQTTAEGHSVRAMYLYCGMADVAAETGDASLIDALHALWHNVVDQRMYLTGGVGSGARGERFTHDYDLPNDTAYAETCAAIGLVFWAHRMLQFEPDRRYADVLERALYNGVLSGVSLDGTRFFYANPLAVDPENNRGAFAPERQEWFGCACCPTNLVRLLASLGEYVYGVSDDALYVHLYARGTATVALSSRAVQVTQTTDYPWDETVTLRLEPEAPGAFTLALRLPEWCREPAVTVNGQRWQGDVEAGYARIERSWAAGDEVVLTLPMPVERVYCRPIVADNTGLVALQRGPLVYCLEGVDHDSGLGRLALPTDAALTAGFEPELFGGTVVVRGEAVRARDWDGPLYRTQPPMAERVPFTAIPYALWQNRGRTEMRVWLREV